MNELKSALSPVILLSVFAGIIFIGTILYLYVFSITKRKLYLSISLMGFLGVSFISCEVIVIVSGILGMPDMGFFFHRLQALAAAFFLGGLPCFVYYLIMPQGKQALVIKILGYSGTVIAVAFLLAAFIYPSGFLLQKTSVSQYTHLWNIGRGIPGALYKIRDLLIAVWASVCAVFLAYNVFTGHRSRHIIYAFTGALIAIFSGVFDVILASREKAEGLFSIRIFSFFSIGMTVFIMLSMIGVMKFFINQTRGIEKAMKLQSLGTLAGGIAHDFNNTLTRIVGNISLLSDEYPKGSEQFTAFRDIESAAYKARTLTEQLLTFSKGGEPVRQITSTSNLIKETASFMMAGSGIDLKFDLADKLWHVDADAGQISQVLQNIVINAKQALKDKGRIIVKAENVPNFQLRGTAKTKGPFVCIEIADNGPGIPGKYLRHIFDPYFTTKEAGSGLGLYICYSIINKHSGSIEVDSDHENGTKFRIYLPATPEKESEPDTGNQYECCGGKKILILEDNADIRMVIRKMLDKIGINCELTAEGSETLEAFKKSRTNKNNYKVVMVDLTIIGGMGGKETAEKILAISPDTKIIISSGYSNDPVMSEYRKYGFHAVIKKPYRLQELERVIFSAFKDSENH